MRCFNGRRKEKVLLFNLISSCRFSFTIFSEKIKYYLYLYRNELCYYFR